MYRPLRIPYYPDCAYIKSCGSLVHYNIYYAPIMPTKYVARQGRIGQAARGTWRWLVSSSVSKQWDWEKQWTNETIPPNSRVSKSAVLAWRKSAMKLLSVDTSTRRLDKQTRLPQRSLLKFEKASIRYMRDVSGYLKNQALFGEDSLGEKALSICSYMFQDVNEEVQKLEGTKMGKDATM